MYRNIGYYITPRSSVLIPAAKRLLSTLNASQIEQKMAEAFREAGFSDRRFMKDMVRSDALQLGKSTLFNENKKNDYKDVLNLLWAVCAASGWGDYQPVVVKYTENPLMTLDEILDACLSDHLDKALSEVGMMWPEKCNMEIFRNHFGEIIKRIAHIDAYRKYIADKLQRYIGDLTYRMKIGEISPSGLDQFDRTLITLLLSEKHPGLLKYRDENGQSQTLITTIDNKDNDPEIAPEIARIKGVVKEGPWLRYTTLISNADQRELMFALGPIAADLPLATGYLVPIGPFYETHLEVASRITWGAAESFSGFAENVQFPAPMNAAQLGYGFRNPAFRLQTEKPLPKKDASGAVVVRYTEDYWQPSEPRFDYPTLDIINDSDAQGKPAIKYSWYSPSKQRMVHSDTGATAMNMLLDLAITSTQMGDSAVEMLTITELKFVDLDDPSLAHMRIIAAGKSEVDDNPGLRTRIFEDIYYFEGGKNLKLMKGVDVTSLTNKLGNVSYRPALARFFIPSLGWFSQTDTIAADYITGRLQLGKYDALRSKMAIAISHNAALYTRITGQAPPFNVAERIRALHNYALTTSIVTTEYSKFITTK